MKRRRGKGFGVSRAMASSIANKRVRIMIRTLTSQASQSRSSKMDCMRDPIPECSSSVVSLRPFLTTDDRRLTTALADLCLARQFGDHREQRYVERNYDASDHDTQQTDDDRFQHGQHVLGGGVDFVFVEVGNLLQHGIHGARSFADADHLGHHVGKYSRFRSGSTMVRPSSMALRTFINASSSTALPDVLA